MKGTASPLTGVALLAIGILLGAIIAGGLYQWETNKRVAVSAEAEPEALPAGTKAGVAVGQTVTPPTPTLAASTATAVTSASLAATPGASTASPAAVPPAAGAPTGDPAAGKATYATFCNACHPDGKAGLGPDLRSIPAANVERTTRQGRGNMPAYKADRLSDKQLADITAYLASLQ